MNILTAVFVILVIWRAIRGLRNGFAREVDGLLSLFMALVILSIILLLLGGIFEKNTKVIGVSIVMLIIANVIYRLLGMMMKSIETVAKLPVINLVNALAGGIAGVLEILAVFWMMYIIIDSFPTGSFGEKVMEWTKQSTLLINVYNKNYIANWIMGIRI